METIIENSCSNCSSPIEEEEVANSALSPIAQAILSISIIFLSSLIDLVFLHISLDSHTKLIRTEHFILVSIGLVSIPNKLIGVLKSLQPVVDMSPLGLLNCILLYSVDLTLSFVYFMIFFFYSLFHLAMIDRRCVFLALIDKLHKHPRNYLVYFALVFISFATFITVYSVRFSNQIFLFVATNNSSTVCILNDSLVGIAPMFVYLLCSITPFVYLLAVALALVRITRHRSNNKTERVNIRRGLVVSLKFFLFSLTILLVTAPQYIFYLSFYSFGFYDRNLDAYMRFVSDLVFLTQSGFLILINVNLRRAFVRVYIRPVCFRFKLIAVKCACCRQGNQNDQSSTQYNI